MMFGWNMMAYLFPPHLWNRLARTLSSATRASVPAMCAILALLLGCGNDDSPRAELGHNEVGLSLVDLADGWVETESSASANQPSVEDAGIRQCFAGVFAETDTTSFRSPMFHLPGTAAFASSLSMAHKSSESAASAVASFDESAIECVARWTSTLSDQKVTISEGKIERQNIADIEDSATSVLIGSEATTLGIKSELNFEFIVARKATVVVFVLFTYADDELSGADNHSAVESLLLRID